MTLDHALRLLAMLTDTVTAQSQQIDALNAEVARLTEPPTTPRPTTSQPFGDDVLLCTTDDKDDPTGPATAPASSAPSSS